MPYEKLIYSHAFEHRSSRSLALLFSSLLSYGYFIITSIYKGTSDGRQSSLSNRPTPTLTPTLTSTRARTRFHIVYLFKRPLCLVAPFLLHCDSCCPLLGLLLPLVNDRSHWQLIRFIVVVATAEGVGVDAGVEVGAEDGVGNVVSVSCCLAFNCADDSAQLRFGNRT